MSDILPTPPNVAALMHELTQKHHYAWKKRELVWNCSSTLGDLTKAYDFADLIMTAQSPAELCMDTRVNKGAVREVYDFMSLDPLPLSIDDRLKQAALEGKTLHFFFSSPFCSMGDKAKSGEKSVGGIKKETDLYKHLLKKRMRFRDLSCYYLYNCVRIAQMYGLNFKITLISKDTAFVGMGSKVFRKWFYANCKFKYGALFSTKYFNGLRNGWSVFYSTWEQGVQQTEQLDVDILGEPTDIPQELSTKRAVNHKTREAWVDDGHIYTIVSHKNQCSALRGVFYNGKLWDVHNHTFWLSRAYFERIAMEHGASELVADLHKDQHEPYMASAISNMGLSPLAQACLDKLNKLFLLSLKDRARWHSLNPQYASLNWDAGVYQLKEMWSSWYPTEFAEFVDARTALANSLKYGVRHWGYL